MSTIYLHTVRLLCFLLLLVSCENDFAEVNEFITEDASGVEVAREVEMLYSDSAVVRLRITGPILKRYTERGRVRDEFPEGVFLEFFDQYGSTSSTLSAGYGVRIPLANKIVVRDNVIYKSNEGERLETSELIWDQNNREVYTNKFIRISNKEEIIWGYGFRANEDFSRYEIESLSGRIDAEGIQDVIQTDED